MTKDTRECISYFLLGGIFGIILDALIQWLI